jgi:hypothetical protein
MSQIKIILKLYTVTSVEHLQNYAHVHGNYIRKCVCFLDCKNDCAFGIVISICSNLSFNHFVQHFPPTS